MVLNAPKAGAMPAFSCSMALAGQGRLRPESGGLEGLDVAVQAGLVAGSLVLVDQATRGVAVEDRLRDGERGLGGGGILGIDGLDDLLDGGTQHRALGRVASIANSGLLGALLGGLDVGHGRLLRETG